ncbi:MAG TPA: glycosyltransferase [Pelolinea sp.]|nr:glycosyltransferase [Pelolinea sp.]
MRIACITTSVVPSKTANSIQALKVVHALKETGHDVRLWVPEFKREDWNQIAEIYGLKTQFDITWLTFLPFSKQYDFAWKSVTAALRWGANIVYTWALQAAVFAQIRSYPTVMEFHDFPMGRLGPQLFKIYIDSKGKKLTLCTTRALADGMEERYNFKFSPKELQIAPNGTEIERYNLLPAPEEARKILGLKPGFTVGYTGHFYAGRGMDLLTDIARQLPEVNFLWVGGREEDIAPWQESLESQSIHNVTITGFIPNSKLPHYQASADILAMPYGKRISGSSGGDISRVINPMKMFDYLATGRPIVASEIPVFHEVLHKDIAVFCQPEDPAEWVKAIRQLQNDAKKRIEMGNLAKKEAKKYTWKNRALTTFSKLETILE